MYKNARPTSNRRFTIYLIHLIHHNLLNTISHFRKEVSSLVWFPWSEKEINLLKRIGISFTPAITCQHFQGLDAPFKMSIAIFSQSKNLSISITLFEASTRPQPLINGSHLYFQKHYPHIVCLEPTRWSHNQNDF